MVGLQNLRKLRVSIASVEARKREKERLNRNGFGFFSGIFWWAFIFGLRERERKRVRFLRNLKGQKKKKVLLHCVLWLCIAELKMVFPGAAESLMMIYKQLSFPSGANIISIPQTFYNSNLNSTGI